MNQLSLAGAGGSRKTGRTKTHIQKLVFMASQIHTLRHTLNLKPGVLNLYPKEPDVEIPRPKSVLNPTSRYVACLDDIQVSQPVLQREPRDIYIYIYIYVHALWAVMYMHMYVHRLASQI